LVLANRLALEVFEEIYDHLDEETRRHITLEVADDIKDNRRAFNEFMIPLLRDAPEEGRRVLDDVIHTAVAREGGTVAKYVMEDLCLYMGTPLSFHYHLAVRPKRRYFTMWMLKNMKRQVQPHVATTKARFGLK
jgi:hypothetical protein